MVLAHGQKTRWLKSIGGGWQTAWQVVVDPGTDNNSSERLGNRYTWARDKYWLKTNEVAGVGAVVITFDYRGVPTGRTLLVEFYGFYTGNHGAPNAPRLEAYDWTLTSWVPITGMELQQGQSTDEHLLGHLRPADGDWWGGTGNNNVRIRIAHPVIGGNLLHELHVNQLTIRRPGVSTTTSTTTTTTTTS